MVWLVSYVLGVGVPVLLSVVRPKEHVKGEETI